MAKRKATILRDGTKDVVELKRSNPKSFDERLEGHRSGGGDARAKLFGRELSVTLLNNAHVWTEDN